MYTENSMASTIEAMRMSLPYSSSTPVEDPLKLDECRLPGKYLLNLIKMDLKLKDIITLKSLHNAMVTVMALVGSTNVVLHLIAIARLEEHLQSFATFWSSGILMEIGKDAMIAAISEDPMSFK
ncbi:Dihydroxy-acid/6-phosphogluconate dehydratase, partial [Cynara cardunculus var. scolymus]